LAEPLEPLGTVFVRSCPDLLLSRADELHRFFIVKLPPDTVDPTEGDESIENLVSGDIATRVRFFVGDEPNTFRLSVMPC
jgi:hypothetical protein